MKIADFGLAQYWRSENKEDTSGTPAYMAPEVMYRQNHGVAVDYYALGIVCYECMLGKMPYNGTTRKEILDEIYDKQIQIKKHEIPEGWSLEAADFINRLIQRRPINRLGLNGPREVKNHPWMKSFPFHKLSKMEKNPPFIPSSRVDNFDASWLNVESEGEDLGVVELLLKKDNVQN